MVEALLVLLLGCDGGSPAPKSPSADELARERKAELGTLCLRPEAIRPRREELEAWLLVEPDAITRAFLAMCLTTLADPRSRAPIATALIAEHHPFTQSYLMLAVLVLDGDSAVDTVVEKYVRGVDPSNDDHFLDSLVEPERADRTRAAVARLSAIDPTRAQRILDALDGKRAPPSE